MSAQDELAVIIAVALKQVPAEQRKRLGHSDWMVAEQAGKIIASGIADAVRRSFDMERKPMQAGPSAMSGAR